MNRPPAAHRRRRSALRPCCARTAHRARGIPPWRGRSAGTSTVLRVDHAAVQQQRNVARRFLSVPNPAMVASTRAFSVVVNAPRRDHVLHGEIRRCRLRHGMRLQPHVRVQPQVVEIRRHAGLLHVRIQLRRRSGRRSDCAMDRTARASSANEVRASEGSIGIDRRVERAWSSVTSLITCTRDPNASTSRPLPRAQPAPPPISPPVSPAPAGRPPACSANCRPPAP